MAIVNNSPLQNYLRSVQNDSRVQPMDGDCFDIALDLRELLLKTDEVTTPELVGVFNGRPGTAALPMHAMVKYNRRFLDGTGIYGSTQPIQEIWEQRAREENAIQEANLPEYRAPEPDIQLRLIKADDIRNQVADYRDVLRFLQSMDDEGEGTVRNRLRGALYLERSFFTEPDFVGDEYSPVVSAFERSQSLDVPVVQSPSAINDGWCKVFAHRVQKRLGYPDWLSVQSDEDRHTWLEYNDRCYDAECTQGVSTPDRLPIFNQRQSSNQRLSM